VKWLFVRNEVRGPLDLLDQSDAGRDLKTLCNPIEITLPALDRKDAATLRNHNMNLAEAIQAKLDGKKIEGITDLIPNLRLKGYQAKVNAEFAGVIGQLIRL
jgi:hypothetical protein